MDASDPTRDEDAIRKMYKEHVIHHVSVYVCVFFLSDKKKHDEYKGRGEEINKSRESGAHYIKFIYSTRLNGET